MTPRSSSRPAHQGTPSTNTEAGCKKGIVGDIGEAAGPGADGKDSALAARATGTSWRARALRYYSLAKPRVLYGNVLTAAAGFLFASVARIDWLLFLAVCMGTTLVIGSACVLNNILDRDIDTLMDRTKKRASVTGDVGVRNASIYAAILGMLGMAILILWTNPLVVGVGLAGFLIYVVFYGMFSKRRSLHGTVVGSISGAAPILGGYVGASNSFDIGSAIAFLMLFLWQFPAFYSIAIYRRAEYARASVPVISVVRGSAHTKVQILFYTVLFVVVSLLPQLFGYTGWIYTAVMAVLGVGWLIAALRGFTAPDDDAWAHLMFRYALIMMCAISVMLAIGPRLV